MPIPSAISDLSTTPSLNSPAGSESPALVDDYLRTQASFIATLRDATPYTPSGTGAVATNVQSKLREFVSVNDYDTVQNAVANAIERSLPLYWPDLVTVTGNIPNFHNVTHTGPGGVVRGGATFYVCPSEAKNQINNIYVSPSGDDVNDGLDPSLPIATLSRAASIIQRYGSGGLTGIWRVRLAAGTYTSVFALSSLTTSEYPVEVRGPSVGGHPNVPTAIIDLSSSPSATAFDSGGGSWLICRDIKVVNATSGQAFKVSRGVMRLVNCHTHNVRFAITYEHGAFMTVEGGVYDGNSIGDSYGVRGYYGSTHSIEGASLAVAPQFKNYFCGLYLTEGCFGHLDFTQVADCTVGVWFSRGGAGCNTRQMQIYRCGTGVRVWNSDWIDNVVDFGLGTANACTVAVDHRGESPEFYFRAQNNASRTGRFQGFIGGFTHAGTTNETTKWTPITIPRGYAMATGDAVRLTIVGTTTGNTGTSAVQIYVDDDYQTGISVNGGVARFEIDVLILFTTATEQRTVARYTDSAGGVKMNYGTGVKSSGNSSLPIRVAIQNANTTDTFACNFATCETTVGG